MLSLEEGRSDGRYRRQSTRCSEGEGELLDQHGQNRCEKTAVTIIQEMSQGHQYQTRTLQPICAFHAVLYSFLWKCWVDTISYHNAFPGAGQGRIATMA